MNTAAIELASPGISCEKCKANIEADLAGEPGIGQVTVHVATRHVRISYDQQHTSPNGCAPGSARSATRPLPGPARRSSAARIGTS